MSCVFSLSEFDAGFSHPLLIGGVRDLVVATYLTDKTYFSHWPWSV